mmetsp:Transcript_31309/g.41435  ORF Transcript_31309/g.41435 Transcript_31309/m.41435 type:complete len:138 (-) Transcript_31309:352-765(-)
MLFRLARLVTFALVATFSLAADKEDRKQKINEIFDNDSDFMRGFETGLFLRTKGGSVEEYGCAAPASTSNAKSEGVFKKVRSAIDTASMALRMDPIVKSTLNVVLEFLDGFNAFLTVLTPSARQELDYYCTGMTFGL